MENADSAGGRPTTTPRLVILLAWAIVGLPWLWGISQTLENAAKLFQ